MEPLVEFAPQKHYSMVAPVQFHLARPAPMRVTLKGVCLHLAVHPCHALDAERNLTVRLANVINLPVTLILSVHAVGREREKS
jgi:hypothetical protein